MNNLIFLSLIFICDDQCSAESLKAQSLSKHKQLAHCGDSISVYKFQKKS